MTLSIFTFIFVVVALINFVLAIYTIHIGKNEPMNRVFSFAYFSLVVWLLSFAFALEAPSFEECLFWRRMSAMGWSFIHVFVLIGFIYMTGHQRYISKWWQKMILFIPAIYSFYVFTLSEEYAYKQYVLIKTEYGWINYAPNNLWDWLFYIYYIAYILISCILLVKWRLSSKKNSEIRKQAKYILLSVLIATVLGSLTDFVLNILLGTQIPQMAPLFFLLPNTAIFYCIKKYRLMRVEGKNDGPKIIDESNKHEFYRNISSVFIISGIMFFVISQILLKDDQEVNTFLIAFLITVIGVVLRYFHFLPLEESFKQKALIVMSILFIPMLALAFTEDILTTIWAFPLIFVVVFLAFDYGIGIYLLFLAFIIMQVIMILKTPNLEVHIDASDYVIRVFIISIAVFVSYHVNRLYQIRLKNHYEQMKFQKYVAEISAKFVRLGKSRNANIIKDVIEFSVKIYDNIGVEIEIYSDRKHDIGVSGMWYSDDADRSIVDSIKDEMAHLDWKEKMKSMPVYVDEVVIMRSDTKNFEKHVVLVIPFVNMDTIIGYMVVYSPKIKGDLQGENQDRIRIVSKIFSDAIIKMKIDSDMNYMIYYDDLTELPNRAGIREHLDASMLRASQLEKQIGILYIDINGFKSINDAVGHMGGDAFLIAIAKHLRGLESEHVFVGRDGGDEFMVIIDDYERHETLQDYAERIVDIFNRSFVIMESEFYITVSIGASQYPIDGENVDELIKNADIAMYAAKANGKNEYVICNEQLKELSYYDSLISHALYKALVNDEFYLLYQPQIDLQTDGLYGMEALIRWQNPELGLVSPSVFIPIAERTGFINEIGAWVLRTACGQCKSWQDEGGVKIPVSVNFSIAQFMRANFVEVVKDILDKSGLEPKYLEVEITERLAMKEERNVNEKLRALRGIGVKVSIDDFGVEYSSLGRVKNMPLDCLKIDMQFVQGIEKYKEDRAITSSIIQLAKRLGLNVIAEGIETKAQRDFLKVEGCDAAQGYFYYKPLIADEMMKLLADDRGLLRE